MVEPGLAERTARVTMSVNVDKANWAFSTDRLQDRMGDRMVATDRQRYRAGCDDIVDKSLDVGVTLLKSITTGKGNVANVCDA